jgi:hypothetical protein
MRRGLVAMVMALPGAALAEDAPKLTLYGMVDPAYLSFDDGQDTKSLIVDNNNAIGRIGAWLDWGFADQTRLKFNFETAIGTRPSNSISMTETPEFFEWSQSDLRKAELIYAAAWGQVSAGQGSMATDKVAELDYSGATVAGYSDYQAVAGGFAFRTADGTPSDITLSKVFTNLDGTRRWRLRYDTPEWSGITAAIAYGSNILSSSDTDTYYDAALRYQGEVGAFRLGGALGYNVTEAENGSTTDNLLGSFSMLHDPTGLNLTLAAGQVISGGNYVYAKAGWIGDLVAVGKTALALEYYGSTDLGVTDGTGQSWGIMVNQALPHAINAYFGYRSYQLTTSRTEYLPASSYLLGAQWTF